MRIMKKIKQFALLVGLTMSIVSSGYAQQRWIAFDSVGVPQKVEFRVVSCDGEAIVINAKIHGVFSQRLNTKGGEFTELSLPDYGYTMEIGKPQLPAIRNFVEIPYGAKFSFEVTRATAQEVSLADVGIATRIVPAQQLR